jgi:hypothetical protein
MNLQQKKTQEVFTLLYEHVWNLVDGEVDPQHAFEDIRQCVRMMITYNQLLVKKRLVEWKVDFDLIAGKKYVACVVDDKKVTVKEQEQYALETIEFSLNGVLIGHGVTPALRPHRYMSKVDKEIKKVKDIISKPVKIDKKDESLAAGLGNLHNYDKETKGHTKTAPVAAAPVKASTEKSEVPADLKFVEIAMSQIDTVKK